MDRKARKCGIGLCLIMVAIAGCGDDKQSDGGTGLPASLKLDDVTNDQAAEICDWLTDKSTVFEPTQDQECSALAVAGSQTPEACEALSKSCNSSKADESEEGDEGCGLTRNNFLGCQATVADLEACFDALRTAASEYFTKVSCADAGTGKTFNLPVTCVDLERRCPSIFDEEADGGFVCDDGVDLDDDAVCDGFSDCKAGEDEDGELCASWQDDATDGVDGPDGDLGFICDDGIDIPDYSRCDYSINCPGGEDEMGCQYPVNDGGFVCADGWDLYDDEKCDGWEDCQDGGDEAGCPVFTCDDGTILVASDQCDGFLDCATGEDEVGCNQS